ncbi:hypothetical protein PRUPE_1G385100 [Prunus persica]|uniref:Uncharacterized protein n=1 Tax=Prunus persica TaxID=3760 RepID=A0A251R9V7_PRUPE|nr:hypothetical protein PRUPE_1G385100 [Prunus persica]
MKSMQMQFNSHVYEVFVEGEQGVFYLIFFIRTVCIMWGTLSELYFCLQAYPNSCQYMEVSLSRTSFKKGCIPTLVSWWSLTLLKEKKRGFPSYYLILYYWSLYDILRHFLRNVFICRPSHLSSCGV